MADRIVVMTSRPGEVKAELKVNLPRPRSPEMMADAAFVDLKRECLAMVREETRKVMGPLPTSLAAPRRAR